MTTLEQALHIFNKDARHMRVEIAGVFLVLIMVLISGVQTWESIQERSYWDSDPEGPLSAMLALAWSLLIARVIQTEALPGDRHFWLTRPYSRTGLLLAKGLFMAVFILLPILVVQVLTIALNGLPLASYIGALLWNQILIAVLILLPIAAIAALTRNLAQFLPAAVLTGAILVGPIADSSSLGDLDWIRMLLALAITGSIATLVLWRQYRLRRSGNTALRAAAALIAGAILYFAFPPSLAFAIQSKLTGSPGEPFALRLAAAAAPGKPETTTPNRYRQLVALPIAITGATPEDLRIHASKVTIRTLSGISREPWYRTSRTKDNLIETLSLDRDFFDAAKDSPVTVKAEFSLTQFGNARTFDVPLDGTPVFIPGLGQCGVVAGYDDRRFLCRSAFRAPQSFQSERVGTDRNERSVFPVLPRIYPIVGRVYDLAGEKTQIAPAAPEKPATLIVREPVAYFHYTMQAQNVRVGEYAIPEPIEGGGDEQ